MRFLIDANMPRSTAELLKRYNHEAVDVRDIGMGSAADSDIAAYAQQNRLVLVTRDFDFADIRNYPPGDMPGFWCWRYRRTQWRDSFFKSWSGLFRKRNWSRHCQAG